METLYKEFKSSGRELSLSEFSFKYDRAKSLIDYLTFGRVDYLDLNLVGKVNGCILELICFEYDQLKSFNESYKANGIKAETVGSQRVDYLTATINDIRNLKRLNENEFYIIVKKYFGLTGLMYRGV